MARSRQSTTEGQMNIQKIMRRPKMLNESGPCSTVLVRYIVAVQGRGGLK